MLYENGHYKNHDRAGGSGLERFETLRKTIMPRAITIIAYGVCVALMGAALSGCAETTYPSLPGLPSVGDSLLTPNEQEKAIKDLSGPKSQTGEVEKPAGDR
jgi:hypothetical protein